MTRVTSKSEGEKPTRARGGDGSLQQPTVIFLHLGKTAGSTLRQIISRNYGAPDTLKAGRQGLPREETLEDFARIPDSRRASARLVFGHTVFGIHELLPKPSTYITLLRDPFKLVLSQYRFVRRQPHHRFHQIVSSRQMSLADYIRSGISMEMDNGQTRAIAGDTSTPFGQCTEDMLQRAQQNIDAFFSVAGLTERFDETLILLREVLGWSHLSYLPANVSPDRMSLEDLPQDTVRLIEEHMALDRELYSFVRRRFDQAISAIPDFDRELRRFQRLNRLYRPWREMTYSMPKRMFLRLRARG